MIYTIKNGKTCEIDVEDHAKVLGYNWHVTEYGYVRGNKPGQPRIMMHRLLLPDVKDTQEVDHIDGNRLNNQKSNLRACSKSNNQWNRKTNKNSSTGFKGVHLDVKSGWYYARIQVSGKRINLGSFSSAESANQARMDALAEYHGEFARTE